MANGKGLLLVISGPSGVGKGTICKALIKRNPKMHFSVSATTRAPRSDEIEGISYFFKTRKEFEDMIEQNAFLEYMLLFNTNYYGTPRAYIEEELAAGNDIILEIDYHGARRVKDTYPSAVLVFILPPSISELQSRLIHHDAEAIDSLDRRMEVVLEEIDAAHYYDYVVVNDILERAVNQIECVVEAEKCRVVRNNARLKYMQEQQLGR